MYQRIAPEVKLGRGSHVCALINDLSTRHVTADGKLQSEADWKCVNTLPSRGVITRNPARVLRMLRTEQH